MAMTHTFSWSYRSGSTLSTDSVELSADVEVIALEIEVPADTADQVLDIDVAADGLVSVYLLSDLDLAVDTDGVDQATINLIGGSPLIWTAEAPYFDNPISADCSQFLLTNASETDAATFTVLVLKTANGSTPA